MKPFQSTFLLIFCFSLSFGIFSQSDTTCIKTRWISVKNTENNAILFDSASSILVEIRQQVKSKKLGINKESRETYSRGQWYPIPDLEYEINEYTNDTLYSIKTQDYFEIYVQSDYPMVDEYGDPIVITEPDGTQSYQYPPGMTHSIKLDNIYEFRIREELTFNKETKQYGGDFRATGISFCMDYGSRTHERFWINLDSFFENIAISDTYPWQSFLNDKKYIGFQYMQVSCYDDLIRY